MIVTRSRLHRLILCATCVWHPCARLVVHAWARRYIGTAMQATSWALIPNWFYSPRCLKLFVGRLVTVRTRKYIRESSPVYVIWWTARLFQQINSRRGSSFMDGVYMYFQLIYCHWFITSMHWELMCSVLRDNALCFMGHTNYPFNLNPYGGLIQIMLNQRYVVGFTCEAIEHQRCTHEQLNMSR